MGKEPRTQRSRSRVAIDAAGLVMLRSTERFMGLEGLGMELQAVFLGMNKSSSSNNHVSAIQPHSRTF